MWHVPPDMWHTTHDMWHVTEGGTWKFSQNLRSLDPVHYGYPVPGEIIRCSGTIFTSKLTSRPLLFQTNIPASRAWASELPGGTNIAEKIQFPPNISRDKWIQCRRGWNTKELWWDESEHSKCTQRRKIRKQKYSKGQLCNANYRTNRKLQKHMHMHIQCILNSSDITCAQRSLQLMRNSSTIGFVCTILLWFKCYLCNTI